MCLFPVQGCTPLVYIFFGRKHASPSPLLVRLLHVILASITSVSRIKSLHSVQRDVESDGRPDGRTDRQLSNTQQEHVAGQRNSQRR